MNAISDPAAGLASGLLIRDLRGPRSGPFTLAVPRGTACVVTGPSGSGKSLFLRLVADLDPGTGTVALDGRERGTMTGPAWRRRVAYVAAEPAWWASGVAAHFAAGTPDPNPLDAAALGLTPDHLRGPVARLSTGERQRLALLRALDRRPACLLLDEPTAALDPDARAATEALLRRLIAAGTTLLVVTHDAAQAERLGASATRRMQAGRFAP